ncbi:MAG: hypothetical protein IPO06_08945 [Leptospiraceae bacterium]|nr:hypothetical protein [Leptospiraceae bacterium]
MLLQLGGCCRRSFYPNVTAAATSVATATVTAATAYYGLVAANQVYASVPYNKKYDAFLTDAGAWTSTTRATAVAAQKLLLT